jgi:DNA-binding MarR family transcriptional regulator
MKRATKDSVDRLVAQWRNERPDLDPSPIEIQGRIMRLAAHLQRQSEARLAALGLTWEAFSMIVTLRRRGKPYELRPTDLLKESLLTSGAITNRIDKVERMGLVQRVHGFPDRRSVTIRLTPRGRKLADSAISAHLDNMESVLAGLPAAARKQLAGLLSSLLLGFETRSSERSASSGAEGKSPSHRRKNFNGSRVNL